jgi:phosphoribosylamine--glycine ligase
MKVLVLGSGGREHALAAALVKSPRLDELFVAPGNPGTAAIASNVALDASDHEAVIALCRVMGVDLVVIGPEGPLVAGLVDDLAAAGVRAFGPGKAAARLEGSKGFTKDFCREFDIPTARYRRCASRVEAEEHLEAHGAPIVVKADGLAAGKGVVVAQTLTEARAAIDAIFGGAFGAGAEAVLEEVLPGEEASFFALCDGERAVPLGAAQDHKRAYDGDLGPNTGGMGAYSPAPVMDEAMSERVMREIIEPTVRGMRRRGTPFRGVLFAGLMIGPKGPALIEYNVRFGDPETQVILPRLESDLLPLLLACADGALEPAAPRFSPRAALTVVLAAKGYPDAPQKGARLDGLERAAQCEGIALYHAGTRIEAGALVASGGRVLDVTALGSTLAEAQRRAYGAVDLIHFPGGFHRRDIGWRALGR